MTIFYIMIAYLIGIILGLYIKNIALLFCIIGSIIILYYISSKIVLKKKWKCIIKLNQKGIIIYCIIIIISYGYITFLEKRFENEYEHINNLNTKFLTNENQILEAIIVSNVSVKSKNTKECIIKVDNKKYKLYIKNNKNELNYGDRIVFEGGYENASSATNYKGFDYQKYLKTKKIYGIINTNKINKIEKNKYNYLLIIFNRIQNQIVEKSNQMLNDKTYSNLLTGIMIGKKDELDEDIVEQFQNSNLSHILAVSGAHVSYIVLGITVCLSKIKVGKKNSKVISICLLIFYIILTGGTSSCTRACIMAIYIIFGGLIYRKPNIIVSISISALIILIINPYKIFEAGFQLSYGGTIGIILFNKILNKNNKTHKSNKIIKNIKQMIIVCLYANIMIFPIIMYHYNTISLTFLLSNILVSPILGLIIILGFINIIISYASIKLAIITSIPLKLLLKLLILIAKICSSLPLSKIYVKTPYIVSIFFYYVCIIIILHFSKIKKKKINDEKLNKEKNIIDAIIKKVKNKQFKKITSLLIIIILIYKCLVFIPGNLKIHFIDVGQGDSTLIITPKHKSILIDGGGRSDSSYDIGKKVLIPYLLDRRITSLDYIIVSHFDYDHCGGIISLIKEIKVKKIIIGKQFENNSNLDEFIKIVNERKIKVIIVQKGEIINVEKNIYFDVLWPDNNNVIKDNLINNNALVLKLNYILNDTNYFSMLFTGDIEKETESELVKMYKNKNILKSIILKVGHHGSNTSSSEDFLKLIKPKIALIGVGKNNKFGHPNEEIIERLESINCKIYRTDEDGEISIFVNKKEKIEITT